MRKAEVKGPFVYANKYRDLPHTQNLILNVSPPKAVLSRYKLRYNYEILSAWYSNMQDLLDRMGWSQAYFAELVGVSPRTVANWCKGNPNPVAMKYLELVCRLLGV